MGFQSANDLIYIIGKLDGKCAGSEFIKILYSQKKLEDLVENDLEPVDLELEQKLLKTMLTLANKKLVRSAHDVSEGGLLVALAEMTFAKELGARVTLSSLCEKELFGEWPSRFVVSIAPSAQIAFEKILNDLSVTFRPIGIVTEASSLTLGTVSISTQELRKAHESALTKFL
jgi:phosphoribosylformylglycinamidine synthase